MIIDSIEDKKAIEAWLIDQLTEYVWNRYTNEEKRVMIVGFELGWLCRDRKIYRDYKTEKQ